MKGAICSLLASALILSAGARVARADKPKKVVIEQFSGTGADKFKRIVVSELGKQGIEVVSDKKRAATEADLGLLNVSDNYAAVAKELGVGAFIDGTVTGSKHVTARLKVKGPDGGALGGGSWNGANEKKLLGALDAGVGKKLAAIFSGGAAAKEEAAPAAEASDGKEVAAAEEAPKPKKAKKVAAADDQAEKPAPKSEEAEATVAESAEPPSRPSRFPSLDLSVGAHVYGRTFSYNQSVAGGQQAYHLAAVPAPAVSFDYFFLPYLGFNVNAEYSVALISQDNQGAKYKTSSMGYGVGLKGRAGLGSTELTGTVGYQDYSFKISPFSDDPNPPQVAAVDYKQLRVGAGIRIPLGTSAALVGGADYLHLLGIGELKDVYFPYATGRGGQGYGGVAFALPWASGMEARVTADFRRYAFSMNSIEKDLMDTHRLAGGATDQYIGANIALGLRH